MVTNAGANIESGAQEAAPQEQKQDAERQRLDEACQACMERVDAPLAERGTPTPQSEGLAADDPDETDEASDDAAGDEDESPVEASSSQDATPEAGPVPATPAGIEVVRGEREFHISGTVIKESQSTAGLSNEQARDVLKTAFPEIANATVRESTKNGVAVVEFLPQPGRKG